MLCFVLVHTISFALLHFDKINSCVLFNYVHKSTPLDGCSILINITKCPVQCKTTFLTLGWMWILVSRSLVCLCFSLYFNFYALLSLCICSLSLPSLGIFHHQFSLGMWSVLSCPAHLRCRSGRGTRKCVIERLDKSQITTVRRLFSKLTFQ